MESIIFQPRFLSKRDRMRILLWKDHSEDSEKEKEYMAESGVWR